MNSVHYSSKKDDWETPQELFDYLDGLYQFELDVCASEYNAKCDHFFTKEKSCLDCENWSNKVFGHNGIFMNPPYGREIGKFVKKAYEQSDKCLGPIVCLLPARTDTNWFHDYCKFADEIFFLRGRLKFSGCRNSAPFPSMVVVFRNALERKNQNNQAFYDLPKIYQRGNRL